MKHVAALVSILVVVGNPVRGQEGGPPAQPGVVEIRLDRSRPGDLFEGIGAVSAGASSRLLIDYPEPWRSHVLDYLFLPKFGAGFQHLKVEIGGDINSTDGTEPSHMRRRGEADFTRGYEWWLMKEAKKRNPDIILDALPWGAPGWIGDGNYWSQDMADYLVSFLHGALEHHGLEINLVGLWNERDYDIAWIKLLRRTLDDAGLSRVRIVAADLNGPPERIWRIAEDMEGDPALRDAVDVIGIHYPHGEVPESAKRLRALGKRLWSSEDGEWEWATMLPLRHLRAQKCNLNYVDRRLTKTLFWSPVTAYYDCLPAPRSGVIKANTPWSGAFEIQPTLWAVAHTTQFAEPGWRYLPEASIRLTDGGSVASLVSPNGREVSLIVETTGASRAQRLDLIIPQHDIERLHVWRTDAIEQFVRDPDLEPADGVFTLMTIPNAVYSLTTTTGQQKGIHASPPPAPFPFPYHDDFKSVAPGSKPRYLSDQGGAFEVEDVSGERWLVQQIEQQGLDWSQATYAYTLLGDPSWNDVDVSAGISFGPVSDGDLPSNPERFVSVIARCFPGSVWAAFETPYPVGYSLRWYADGRWILVKARGILAEGRTAPPGEGRHQLRIVARGNRIAAYIGDRMVAEVEDTTHLNGLAGLASSFDRNLFDDLQVQPPNQQ